MKSLSIQSCIFFCLFLVGGLVQADELRVLHLRDKVERRKNPKQVFVLKQDDLLSSGDTLRTRASSRLKFGEKSAGGLEVILWESSELNLRSWSPAPSSLHVLLKEGHVSARVLVKRDQHEVPAILVETPQIQVKVLGTEFDVYYSGKEKLSRVCVEQGVVLVKDLRSKKAEWIRVIREEQLEVGQNQKISQGCSIPKAQ